MALLFFLAGCASVHAERLGQDIVEKAMEAAEVVVIAKVADQRVSDEPLDTLVESQEGSYMAKVEVIHTYVTMVTEEVISGEIDNEFTLRILGGRPEQGDGMVSSLSYEVFDDERLLLFLGEDPHNPGQYTSYGHRWGAFTTIADPEKNDDYVLPKKLMTIAKPTRVKIQPDRSHLRISDVMAMMDAKESSR